jgi:hypothetical protein
MEIQCYDPEFGAGMPKPPKKLIKGTRRQRIKKRRLETKNFEKSLATIWENGKTPEQLFGSLPRRISDFTTK